MALCVIILVPLIFFSITDYKSKDVLAMPHRFYPDTVLTSMKNGKEISDTVWHSIKNFQLTNQLGNTVSLDNLQGRVIVADFFFTRCPSICPSLTRNMKKLQDALILNDAMKRVDTSFVHFLSFSVDPERDTVTQLKKYADRYGVNPDLWWLLTGPKKSIYDFALDELKLGLADGEGVDSNFIHTQKMVLLDKDHVVRGYYNGLDSVDLAKLANDIVFISIEKDKHSQSALLELKPLLPMMAIIVLGTTLAVIYFSRKEQQN